MDRRDRLRARRRRLLDGVLHADEAERKVDEPRAYARTLLRRAYGRSGGRLLPRDRRRQVPANQPSRSRPDLQALRPERRPTEKRPGPRRNRTRARQDVPTDRRPQVPRPSKILRRHSRRRGRFHFLAIEVFIHSSCRGNRRLYHRHTVCDRFERTGEKLGTHC